MAKLKRTAFTSFHDKDTLCGFVYMATVNELTFIMFLPLSSEGMLLAVQAEGEVKRWVAARPRLTMEEKMPWIL